MKEFIEFIKKLWKNKKTRSLAILILYGIFFIFVFALINSASPSTLPKPVESTNPFDYLKIREIDKIEFSGINVFVYDDGVIYYNDIIYNTNEVPAELLMYDFSIFNINNIYNLLNKSILESTNHILNSNTYAISVKDFYDIIYNENVDVESMIRITIYENDMNTIDIDFSEFYGYKTKIYLRS